MGPHTTTGKFQRSPHHFPFSAADLRGFDPTLNCLYYYLTAHFNVTYGRAFLISLF